MAPEVPISLDQRVTVIEDKVSDLLKKIEEEGARLPRLDGPRWYGVGTLLSIANGPVGISLEAYQQSLGDKYRGRVEYATDRERAAAVRRQFMEFLKVIEPI